MKKMWPLIVTVCSGLAALGFLGYSVYVQHRYDEQAKAGTLNGDPRVYTAMFFERGTYYILIVLLLLWLSQLILVLRAREFSMKAFLQRHWPEFLISAVITVFCFLSVPPRFRVLSDEANLVSVSQNMLYEKTVLNNVMSKYYYGNLQEIPAEQRREKRPFLYPFFVNVLHVIRGFDVWNAFLTNALTLFALLALVGILAQRYIGRIAGAAAMLLVATYPLVCLCATSAGFDLLAAFFLCVVLVTTAAFMSKPSADTFGLVWITAIVFAHTRYESGLVFFIVITALAVLGYVEAEYFEPNWHHYALTPWLVMPLILQRQLLGNQFENTTGTPDFSAQHFIDHTSELLGTLVNFGHLWPYATLLNWVALLCLLPVIAAVFIKPNVLQWHRAFFAIAFVTIAGLLLLYLSYYFGASTHPASARFFVFFCIVAALLPVGFRYFYPNVLGNFGLLAIAVISAVMYHPISIENRFTNTQTLIRETEAEYDYVNKIKDHRVLIITDRPVDFVALGYGSVDFTYANQHYGELMAELNQGLYAILVLQRISYNNRWPSPGCNFTVPFDLKIVKEVQFSGGDAPGGGEFLRISWVGGVMP